jgi:GNAT superfamily N-acetyltransferase
MASPPPLSSLKSYARLACAAKPEDELALVAELPGDDASTSSRDVVGVVGVLFDRELKPHEMRLDPSTAYVTNLAVSPRCRRRGAGLSLLRAAEDAARDAGFDTVACRVEETNVAARAMYDGLGYDAHEPARIGKFRCVLYTFFTRRSVSTFDRVSFQLTDALFLYGMAL